jgi:hypothetical protein
MIHGLDTGFLVAAEVREHAAHAGIQSLLTTNQSDFLVFGVFTCISPAAGGMNP